MIRFAFKTNRKGYEFCEGILKEMVDLFSIDEAEALERMNRSWKGMDLIDDDDLLYHETREYWAYTLYYGKESYWWMNPPGLRPLPYP